jgi:hypothetical protein
MLYELRRAFHFCGCSLSLGLVKSPMLFPDTNLHQGQAFAVTLVSCFSDTRTPRQGIQDRVVLLCLPVKCDCGLWYMTPYSFIDKYQSTFHFSTVKMEAVQVSRHRTSCLCICISYGLDGRLSIPGKIFFFFVFKVR